MPRKVKLLVGSKKGVFILESDERRRRGVLAGPFCETWPIHHVVGDPRDGAIYGAGGNEWFGPAVWKSTDGGARWTHSSRGLAYAAGETPIKAAWSVALAHGRLYAGSSRRACSSVTTAARASRRCRACATTRRVRIGSRAAPA